MPISLGGVGEVFHDPGFEVRGKTRKDQVWISQTQETGIRVLGWERPAKRTFRPAVKRAKPVAEKAVIREAPEPQTPADFEATDTPKPKPKKKWWQRK